MGFNWELECKIHFVKSKSSVLLIIDTSSNLSSTNVVCFVVVISIYAGDWLMAPNSRNEFWLLDVINLLSIKQFGTDNNNNNTQLVTRHNSIIK